MVVGRERFFKFIYCNLPCFLVPHPRTARLLEQLKDKENATNQMLQDTVKASQRERMLRVG